VNYICLRTIDAHVGGQPTRLIVDGFPSPRGKTMSDKRAWALRHADHIRRMLIREPRGHLDMCGAVLTEPVSPGAHAGVLFMQDDGFPVLAGDAVAAVVTIALERGLIEPGGDGTTVVLDTAAGTIRAKADREGGRIRRVAYTLPPSFVLKGGVDIAIGNRRIKTDIAFGGLFYAIVDSESAGLPLDGRYLPELRRVGNEITDAVEATMTVNHPLDSGLSGVSGTIFTAPPRAAAADLRNVTVSRTGAVDRSACGTATAAVMAVIEAMGLLDDGRAFTPESLIETTLTARVAARTLVGEIAAIVVEIESSAHVTGEHTFVADDDDPFRGGFRVG
jgi:proline racemase